jgi:ferredoxin
MGSRRTRALDCIHPKKNTTYDDGRPKFDDVPQLYIDPVECIDCGACVPVCPVSAIFALDDLLEKWKQYTELNESYVKAGKFTPEEFAKHQAIRAATQQPNHGPDRRSGGRAHLFHRKNRNPQLMAGAERRNRTSRTCHREQFFPKGLSPTRSTDRHYFATIRSSGTSTSSTPRKEKRSFTR